MSRYITMISPWLMVEPHWIPFQINSLWRLKPCVFTQVKLMSRSNWVKPNLADLEYWAAAPHVLEDVGTS